jgi:glycosyltransferase involved in cell wall biosynthesis
MLLISFVMATRNASAFLSPALASIPEDTQEFRHEVVLADGGSRDATLAIAAADPRVRVVSRADGGIYDGMNRAIGAAKGELLLLLNGDDLLLPARFIEAARLLAQTPALGHVSGGALFGAAPEAATDRRYRQALSPEGALFGVPVINARLIRSALVRDIGPFRPELGLGADREWLLRLVRKGARSVDSGAPFYFYRQHAGSHTLAGGLAGRQRVYHAEAQLAAGCLRDASCSLDERRLLRAAGALARLKLRLTRSEPPPAGPMTLTPADLLRGLLLARRWRGRLSGF